MFGDNEQKQTTKMFIKNFFRNSVSKISLNTNKFEFTEMK